jgi:lysyl-tRNA synthetase class 2
MSLRASATLDALRVRASVLTRVRAHFAAHGVLEVDTPALSPAATPDPALHSIAAHVASLGRRLFLHTSPEFAMKRLLAAGSGDIYQIARVFRDDELGRWHQPEFTLLEWYRVGWDDQRLAQEVAALLPNILAPHYDVAGTTHLSYADAIEAALGVGAYADAQSIADSLSSRGVDVPARTSRDALLDLAMSTLVTPRFPARQVTFIHDYPASQAALARLRGQDPRVAARFEVFLGPVEIGNGFHELCDADEQLARFERENAARRARGGAAMPLDSDFIDALRSGLPDCAGIAIGLDRLVAIAAGGDGLAAGIAFAHTHVS